MSAAWLWLTVPLAPLMFLLLLICFPTMLNRFTPWLWVSCVPAIFCSLVPPESYNPEYLWRGASLGGQQLLVIAWLGLTSLLWAAAGAYAATSMKDSQHLLRFWTFWLLSLSGNLLLVIAQDALSFYVGFSMMSLAAYGLVIHDGTSSARRAGRLYLQLAILGEVLLLSGLLMRAHAAGGSFYFADWITSPVDQLTALLLLIGLGLKAGFWPLHVWLPLAHPAAPAPASAVLSGAMIKAGIFGIWLFLPSTPLPTLTQHVGWSLHNWSEAAMVIGLFSAFFGVTFGLIRDNPKQVLAYSSVSQMGYLLFILGLSWQLPGQRDALLLVLLIYAVHHGIAKAVLFLATDLLKSGHASNRMQALVLMLGVAVSALALCGLMFSTGAAAKTGLKSVLDYSRLDAWLPWLQAGAVASTVLLARVCLLLVKLYQKPTEQSLSSSRLLIWGCLAAEPMVLPWSWTPMSDALKQTLEISKLFELSWPIVVGIMVTMVAIAGQWKVPTNLARMTNPFLNLSMRLARQSKRTWLPAFSVSPDNNVLRGYERRWNRYWQGGTVNRSAILLLVFMVVAASFMLVS